MTNDEIAEIFTETRAFIQGKLENHRTPPASNVCRRYRHIGMQ